MEKLRSNNCSQRHRLLKLPLLLQAERSGTKHPSLGSKKKVKKKVDLLLTGAGELVMCDMEKIKVLNAFSPSVSTEECHWKVALYYLQNVTATLAPDDWKKANMTSIFGKGKKRWLGVASMDLSRENHAWLIWWLSLMTACHSPLFSTCAYLEYCVLVFGSPIHERNQYTGMGSVEGHQAG